MSLLLIPQPFVQRAGPFCVPLSPLGERVRVRGNLQSNTPSMVIRTVSPHCTNCRSTVCFLNNQLHSVLSIKMAFGIGSPKFWAMEKV